MKPDINLFKISNNNEFIAVQYKSSNKNCLLELYNHDEFISYCNDIVK